MDQITDTQKIGHSPYVADKALKMLDWAATISEYRGAGR
jgi:hypothetical protein